VRVELLEGATGDLRNAVEWYALRSVRTATAFIHEIDRGLDLVSRTSALWPEFEAGTRRYVLRRYPYSVIYRVHEGVVEVVAIAHHRRKPGYWSKR
jgi:toxin ParE1/3/4